MCPAAASAFRLINFIWVRKCATTFGRWPDRRQHPLRQLIRFRDAYAATTSPPPTTIGLSSSQEYLNTAPSTFWPFLRTPIDCGSCSPNFDNKALERVGALVFTSNLQLIGWRVASTRATPRAAGDRRTRAIGAVQQTTQADGRH